eukprot:scaffold100691_cov63-Phaeocystis_antarctica.AAC.2
MESEREGGRSTNWRVDTAMCAPPRAIAKGERAAQLSAHRGARAKGDLARVLGSHREVQSRAQRCAQSAHSTGLRCTCEAWSSSRWFFYRGT